VDGDEEVSLRFVGDGGAGLEGDEGVVGAGVDDLDAEFVRQQLAEAEGDVEHDVLLFDAVDAERAGVVAAVACVDDDASDLEAERAGERALAVGGEVGFVRGRGIIVCGSG